MITCRRPLELWEALFHSCDLQLVMDVLNSSRMATQASESTCGIHAVELTLSAGPLDQPAQQKKSSSMKRKVTSGTKMQLRSMVPLFHSRAAINWGSSKQLKSRATCT
eukprot:1155857-Pelagomonas_calceolata.AAC.11